jgi:hypothetical protein
MRFEIWREKIDDLKGRPETISQQVVDSQDRVVVELTMYWLGHFGLSEG